jgi:hypothetical protein
MQAARRAGFERCREAAAGAVARTVSVRAGSPTFLDDGVVRVKPDAGDVFSVDGSSSDPPRSA